MRRAIFTFANIPARVARADIPKVAREVEAATLVMALAAASAGDLAEVAGFILDNMPRRLANLLREEVEQLGRVKFRAGDEAMTQVVNTARRLAASGEIALVMPEDGEDA